MTDFKFKSIVVCSNPMEIEIFPATLREQEIPHRTEWNAEGELSIQVPEEWEQEAREALDRAAKIFFNKGSSGPDDGLAPPQTRDGSPAADDQDSAENEEEEYAEGGLFENRSSFFDREAMPTPEETKIRAVWPAWALAALPGTGLGHLYAGKFQMFLYLVFMSILGLMFFEYTGSWLSFLLNVFAWSMDLGFAALHIKEHNRRAIRFRRMTKKLEENFYSSLKERPE